MQPATSLVSPSSVSCRIDYGRSVSYGHSVGQVCRIDVDDGHGISHSVRLSDWRLGAASCQSEQSKSDQYVLHRLVSFSASNSPTVLARATLAASR